MTPFEELLRDLGSKMGISLKPDAKQSCCLNFGEGFSIQIDLGHNGDQILIGARLGVLAAGSYADRMLKAALHMNGQLKAKGYLAFSEKKGELILFQYLFLAPLTAERLYKFLLVFAHHGFVWLDAFRQGEVPALEETAGQKSGFMGLK
jgi:hypothetical protein